MAAAPSNGSFENGAHTNAPFDTVFGIDAVTIDGWTVGGHSVDWIGSYWPAEDGNRSIDLNGNGPGSVSQVLDTVVGATYSVDFALSGNTDGGPSLKELSVSATGAASQPFTFDASSGGAQANNWVTENYIFVATTALTTLTFSSTMAADNPYGPALDNVVVTETLATAEDCKKDGWKGMFDTSLNAFKNQGDCVSFFATGGKNVADGGPFDFTP